MTSDTKIRRNARWLLRLTALRPLQMAGAAYRSIWFVVLVSLSIPTLSKSTGFCLSTVGQRPSEDFTGQSDMGLKPVTLDFTAHGKIYHLVSGKHHVALQDDQYHVLSVANSRQEQGQISRLEIKGRDLLIEGGTDYLGWIDTQSDPPKLGEHPEEFVNLKFSAGGKAYRLVSHRQLGYFVELLDGEGKHIAELPIKHIDDDRIFNFALSKSGWLWIDGSAANYVAHIDLTTTPPRISTPVELSELTGTECFPLTWLLGCYRTQGFYSYALERVFVSSTSRSLFGLLPPVNLEVVDGKSSPLPEALSHVESRDKFIGVKQLLFRDVPELHGALFRGASGEALFYDGKTVTSLLKPDIYGKNPRWFLSSNTFNKQIILNIESGTKAFRVEVNPDLTVTTILVMNNSFGNDINNVHNLDGFWVAGQGIYVKSATTLNSVVIAHQPLYLRNYDVIGISPNKTFVFNVINLLTNKSRDYFIVPTLPTTQCMAMLDPDNPFVLSSEK